MVESFDAALSKLLDAGAPFREAFETALRVSWRGAEEPVQSVFADCSSVLCVCGVVFRFKDGAERAKCPGCGCRYERAEESF